MIRDIIKKKNVLSFFICDVIIRDKLKETPLVKY